MAIELKIDTIEDSIIELGTIDRRIIRKAIVSGLEASATHGYQFAALRAPGMPQLRDRHPQVPDMFLQWQRVRGRSGDTMEVELEYRPNITTAFNSGAVIFRDRTAIQTEVAESMFGDTFSPFTIIDPSSPDSTNLISGRMNRITAIRQLDVDAILTNRPIQASILVGTVNDRVWCGLPKGYWLCVRFETGISSVDRSKYSYGASFLSRRDRNWSEWDFARDQLGRISANAQVDEAAAQMRDKYSYGITRYAGVTVAGQYPDIPFEQAFGFKSEFATNVNIPTRR